MDAPENQIVIVGGAAALDASGTVDTSFRIAEKDAAAAELKRLATEEEQRKASATPPSNVQQRAANTPLDDANFDDLDMFNDDDFDFDHADL